MSTYGDIRSWSRRDRIERAKEFQIDLQSWHHPYTRFKSSLYSELAVPIITFCAKVHLRPNHVTALYIGTSLLALASVLTGTSLGLLFALAIMFLNGSLDWADGALARWTNQKSDVGAIFDPMAGRVKQVCFISIIYIVVYQYTGTSWWLYANTIILISFIILTTVPTPEYPHISSPDSSNLTELRSRVGRRGKWLRTLISFLYYDGRARSTDSLIVLLCLLIFADLPIIFFFTVIWLPIYTGLALFTTYRVTRIGQ